MKLSVDNTTDNATLIKQYLKGKTAFLANRELRIETVFQERHLSTNTGQLIAKGTFEDQAITLFIRKESEYWSLIHSKALKRSIVPINEPAYSGFLKYEYHPVPEGYHLNCDEAQYLWKFWWLNRRRLQLMDLVIYRHHSWYPIRNIICQQGTLYVKTWGGEISLRFDDAALWAHHLKHELSQEQASFMSFQDRLPVHSIHPCYWHYQGYRQHQTQPIPSRQGNVSNVSDRDAHLTEVEMNEAV
jgi:hypothetical protein